MEYDAKDLSSGVSFESSELTLRKNAFTESLEKALAAKESLAERARANGKDDEFHAHLYYCVQYKEIQKMTISTLQDLDFAVWIFNRGNLRSPEELARKHDEIINEKRAKRLKRILDSEEYNKGYHPYLLFALSTILFPIVLSLFADDSLKFIFEYVFISGHLAGIPIFLPPVMITFFYCKIHDERFGVTNSSTIKTIAAASIAGCISTYISHKLSKSNNNSPVNKEV